MAREFKLSLSSVLTSLNTQVSTILGSDWKELKYIYDPEKNDHRSQNNGFGVGFSGSATVPGTTKAVTYDSEIFVVLTSQFANRSSDSSQREAISTLLDKKELLDVSIFQKKLNNSAVLLVSEIGTEAPEIIGEGVVMMRFSYTIKTRNQTI